MSVIDHGELRRLFVEASRLGVAERRAFLDAECEGAPALRAEVEAMLEVDDDPEQAFDANQGGAELLAKALTDEGRIGGAAPQPLQRLGRYLVQEKIAEGGMGIVYAARHEGSGRRVALKVIRPSLVTESLLRRFRREVRVLGQLHHPGIAQIYDAGTEESEGESRPYFAMELVEGRALDVHVREHDLDVGARLELIARVCEALQHAHDKGVVHRDLKPSNILVPDATTLATVTTRSPHATLAWPKILDFGVARTTDADLATVTLQTTEGQLVGTLPYMSPEQAAGDPEAIDPRSDVYSMGVMAFELLTGRLPYGVRGKLAHEAVRVIQEEEPSSLSELDSAYRGDVETIVAKALEKDPERRYASAQALADDIRRYNDHLPIAARPVSTLYQLRKFARRNKALVGGAAATLLVAIVGALVATSFALEASRRARAMERSSYISGISAAASALAMEDFATAERYLERAPEVHRGWEYDYLRAQLTHHAATWEQAGPLVTPLALDGASNRAYGITEDAHLVAWDAETGNLMERRSLAYLLRTPIPSLRPKLARLHGPTRRLAIVLSEEELLVASFDGTEAMRYESPYPLMDIYDWDASGKRLLLEADVPGVKIWEEGGFRIVAPHLSAGNQGAFDPLGNRVVIRLREDEYAGRLALVDLSSGEVLAERTFSDDPTALAFSPDGDQIAMGGAFRNVWILEGRTLEDLHHLAGHEALVSSLAWGERGGTLYSASDDGTVRIWDLQGASRFRSLPIEPKPGRTQLLLTPTAILAQGANLSAIPYDEPGVLRGHESYVYRLQYSPDGAILASSGHREPWIHLWDTGSARPEKRLPSPRTGRGDLWTSTPLLVFSEDSRDLVAWTSRGTRHWSLPEGIEHPLEDEALSGNHVITALGPIDERLVHGNVALSPDRRRVIITWGSKVAVFKVQTEIGPLLGEGAHFQGDRGFRFESGPELELGRLVGHEGVVYCVAFSPDGSRIATGGNDTTVRIWDAETREELLVLRGHTQYVKDVQFSPDGTQLASASGDRTIRLWDTKPRLSGNAGE